MRLSRSAALVLLALPLLCTGLVSTAVAQSPARTVEDTLALPADGSLSIGNHEGSITVTTWKRDRVRYEARIMPTEDDPTAQKVHIQTQTNGNQVQIATVHEEGDDESVVFGFTEDGFQWGGIDIPAVHYTISMPQTADLSINDHESTIEVTGHAGRLEIDAHESPISVRDQQGDVHIDTHEGRMELRRVTGRLTVNTHEGALSVEALEGGLQFDSHEGNADVSFAAAPDESVHVATHEGDVTLHLPAGTGFDLTTDFDDDADLRSGFDLESIRHTEEDDEVVNYHGAVNGGGPMIRLTSHEGRFSLRPHSDEQ